MTTLLIIIHVLVSLFLIAIVLLQHGKGADIGATFGGSGQSVFGTEGPVPLLNKITTFSAIIFMGTSVTLAYISANESTSSIMKDLPAQETATPVKKEAPVTIPMPEETQAVDQLEEPAQETAPEQEASPFVQDNESAGAVEPTATEEPEAAPAVQEAPSKEENVVTPVAQESETAETAESTAVQEPAAEARELEAPSSSAESAEQTAPVEQVEQPVNEEVAPKQAE